MSANSVVGAGPFSSFEHPDGKRPVDTLPLNHSLSRAVRCACQIGNLILGYEEKGPVVLRVQMETGRMWWSFRDW